MRAFTRLFAELERTTRTSAKLAALERYFGAASPADAAWALHFLIGRHPGRSVTGANLRAWVAEAADLPPWLVAASFAAVGDLAETAALLAPGSGAGTDAPLAELVRTRLLPLATMEEAARRREVIGTWRLLDEAQRLVWNKLITGSFRAGVGRPLVVRALAAAYGIEVPVLAHRVGGRWEPSAATWRRLVHGSASRDEQARPYPFFDAQALSGEPASLGDIHDWQAEWAWPGIRAQLLQRGGATLLWSHGEELITDFFPELADAARLLPDGTVLDGVVMAWGDGGPLPFAVLRNRLGRKRVTARLLEDAPARLIIHDVLEIAGEDVRSSPLRVRRAWLDAELAARTASLPLHITPLLRPSGWVDLARLRAEARVHGAEGLVLKRLDSAYGAGGATGEWREWKVEPHTVLAVLMYAERGRGDRAAAFADYTFGVWDGEALVPLAKTSAGLTDAQLRRLDRHIQRTTVERFGPVRAVAPELVFEIAFESLRASRRHRAGVAVRAPRIARWRTDLGAADADTIGRVRTLLPSRADGA